MSTTNTASKTPNYRIYDRTGSGVTKDIYAESLEDAIKQGREWIEDGDWSDCGGNEEGEYRTIMLDCEVGPILRTVYYVDRYSSGSPNVFQGPFASLDEAREVINEEDVEVQIKPYDGVMERVCRSQEANGVDIDNLTVGLVEAWAATEDDEDYVAIYSATGMDVDGDEDDLATSDAERHNCSGTYSNSLPECEADPDGLSSSADDSDESGHVWVTSYRCCGGIKENPGYWSLGGTRSKSMYVCACCGMLKTEIHPGCQRNPDEPESIITLEERNETTTQWLKDRHEEDGWIPEWLAEYLDCPTTVRMTEEEAKEWVESHSDEDELDEDELEHAFAAIFGRRADDQAREEGLWSHLNA